MTQDELKKATALAALEYVEAGIIGVGTGSTANHFIDALAKIKHKIDGAVASSEATAQRLKENTIALRPRQTSSAHRTGSPCCPSTSTSSVLFYQGRDR